MFECKSRYKYNSYYLLKKSIAVLIAVVLFVLLVLNVFGILAIIPRSLYLDIKNPGMNLLTNSLFFGLLSKVLFFPFSIFEKFFRFKCIKIYNNECLELINTVKLPEKLPKVLYIYSTHNDFIESRLIQNSKQTYKNFEVGVSDGSSSIEGRNKIKEFCSKNKINLFQLPPEGSKNKADNTNRFLENYKNDYDFLMIGDADEVFHPNFVEYAVKMFYSNKIKKLAYVVPLNINYKSKGIFPNTLRIFDSISSFFCAQKSYLYSIFPNLSGQSALISKKYLLECNKKEGFDEGNLEDGYLETAVMENEAFGVFLPSTPCLFEADVNISSCINRVMRIEDGRIRWGKIRPKEIVKNYSDRYLNGYTNSMTLIRPFILLFPLGIFALLVGVFSNGGNYAFANNILFGIFVGFFIFSYAITFLINVYLFRKLLTDFWVIILLPIIMVFFGFCLYIYVLIHGFKAFILGKYSQFGGSGKSRISKKFKKPLIKGGISFVILSIIIALFNILIFTQVDWMSMKGLIIFPDVFLGSIGFSCFSLLACWYINLIPYNTTFDRNIFFDCKDFDYGF